MKLKHVARNKMGFDDIYGVRCRLKGFRYI